MSPLGLILHWNQDIISVSSCIGQDYDILVHEEQHAINGLFGRKRGNFRFGLSRLSESETNEDRDRAIRYYFQDLRDTSLERAKDEIIAYFKDGRMGPLIILEELTKTHEEGGIYDYFEEYFTEEGDKGLHNFIAEKLGGEEKVPKNLTEIREDVFRREYKTILAEGIASYVELKNRGLSDEKIAAIFLQEPLIKWKKATERLLGAGPLKYKQEEEGEKKPYVSKRMSPEDIRTFHRLQFKKAAGVLSKDEVASLDSLANLRENETEKLLGPHFTAEQVLRDDEKLKRKIAFLEEWNNFSDDEQIERLVRIDQLKQMADWNDEQLTIEREKAKSHRKEFGGATDELIKRRRDPTPLTREEEAEYLRLSEKYAMSYSQITDQEEERLDDLINKIYAERENLIDCGLSGPMFYRQNTEAYLEFLREWKEKNPEERKASLERLEKLNSMLEMAKQQKNY
jgi:hypothetical protein